MPKKILITSMRAGMGHIKAAQSLETACMKFFPETEVKNLDILNFANHWINFFYNDLYVIINKYIPELYAFVYKHHKLVGWFSKSRSFFDKLNFHKFLKAVNEYDPDIIVATHFIPAQILATYREEKNKKYKLAVVITDYQAHPLWAVKKADLNIAACENVKQSLIFYGLDSSKIEIIGIPIPPQIAEKKDVKALKIKHGVTEGSPVVLFSSGSFGFMPLTKIIDGLKAIKKDLQLLVVCGKNEKLKKELEQKMFSEPRLKNIFGFVNFMDELMAVSNIIVTKPGGITTSEALAMGLPMILTDPVPGQEEGNAYYLTENGAAREVGSLPDLFSELNFILENPEEIKKMSLNAKRLARPHASKEIIERLLKVF